MVRKKEDPQKVKARVKRYLEKKQQILITGLTNKEKEAFINIPYLETFKHARKLMILVDFWNKNHKEAKDKLGKKPNFKNSPENPFSEIIKIMAESAKNNDTKVKKKYPQEEIAALIDKLLGNKPLYNTPQNKAYWKSFLNNEPVKKAFDQLSRIDQRFKYLVINNYISITEAQIVELSQFPEKKLFKQLKELLDLTRFKKGK
jgi:hypothetical protein